MGVPGVEKSDMILKQLLYKIFMESDSHEIAL